MKPIFGVLVHCVPYSLLAFCTLPTVAQSSQQTSVFKVGTFDRSSMEFATGVPNQRVNFIVGQSDPAKTWFANQEAELRLAKAVGTTTAPRTITFSMNHTPAGAYQLHVSVLIETACVPALKVDINGKQGLFFLHPKLEYSNGDQNDSFYPAYSSADVQFTFSRGFLHLGSNSITLQAIVLADQAVPDAGLNYDAIELDEEPSSVNPDSSSALVAPSIFFRERNGKLEEMVEAFIRYDKKVSKGGNAVLTMTGKQYGQMLLGNQDFGEEKLEFWVPEFLPQTPMKLAWVVNGHRKVSERPIDPKKKWTLFVVPQVHLDIGYTDYQAKVAAIQSRTIDEALEMEMKHPTFRFSLDGEWDLAQFLRTRTPAQQQRAISAIQGGRLFVPAQYANLLTGFPTAETLIRSLYPSANFSRIHGTPFDYANLTDVPSYSWSYASVLAAAGIKYLAGGPNNYRAPVLLQGHLNENSPFWWEGPDGNKVLLWLSRHYLQTQFLFGLTPLPSAGHDMLPVFLQMYDHPTYRANAAILYGTQVENTDLFPQHAELAERWNNIYAYPHLTYSGFHEALESIAQQFGNDLPTIKGDGGPYWEDGIASDAHYAAMERWNEGRAPSAEKLATLTSLVNPNLATDRSSLDRMWEDILLMDEHTWTSSNSGTDPTSLEAVKQLEVKDQYAVNARATADFLTQSSMAGIVNSISVGSGNLIVFNTLNWKRSGLVSIDLNNSDQIVDKITGQVIPVEVTAGGNAFHHARFLARDVPAVGYKVFELRPADQTLSIPETASANTLESPYYRVELDPASGAVRGIFDKQLKRELVNQQSAYRFGQYIYVTGGDLAPNTLLQYSNVYPRACLVVHPAQNGAVVSVMQTPYGRVARLKSNDTNTPNIFTEIRLFNAEKKIEIVEDIDKTEVSSKEAAYFAFPFAMGQPQFRYEIQNGVVDPAKNFYPGAGHGWFSVQHWVSVEEDGISAALMPLDAPLVTLGDINRGEWPTQFGKRPGTIFSYVMNNYWDTNYRAAQGGRFRFHYVITSAPSTNSSELSRLGWEGITPLETNVVTYQDKALNVPRPLDAKQNSFLDVRDPDLLLETWKPAEDGNGTILRFLDLGGLVRTVTVGTPLLKLEHAWKTNAVEQGQQQLVLDGKNSFQFVIHPNEIVTVRIIGQNALSSPSL